MKTILFFVFTECCLKLFAQARINDELPIISDVICKIDDVTGWDKNNNWSFLGFKKKYKMENS
jgi:hypothetical protein